MAIGNEHIYTSSATDVFLDLFLRSPLNLAWGKSIVIELIPIVGK